MSEPLRESRSSDSPETGSEKERSDLDWSPEELAAMNGEADAADPVAHPTPQSDVPPETEGAEGAEGAHGAEVSSSEGQGDAGDDPAAFLDTRERKESYTPEEYEKLVKQRDWFQNQSRRQGKQIETVSERVERLAGALERQAEQPPEPAPDRQDDPTGFLDHRIEEVEGKIDRTLETIEQRDQRAEMERRENAFQVASERAEKAHLQETGQTQEQYRGKLVALRKDRYQDFLDEGYEEDEAWRLLQGWEAKLITSAAQRGENPAAVMDRFFQRRGLTVEAPGTDDPKPQPKQQEEGPSTEEVIQRAKQGVKTKTPSDEAVPRGKSFKITYDSLARMSPEEMEEVLAEIEGTDRADELDLTGQTLVRLT